MHKEGNILVGRPYEAHYLYLTCGMFNRHVQYRENSVRKVIKGKDQQYTNLSYQTVIHIASLMDAHIVFYDQGILVVRVVWVIY